MSDFFTDLELQLRAAHARDIAPRRLWRPTRRPRLVPIIATAAAAVVAVAIVVIPLATRSADRAPRPAAPAGDCSTPPQIDLSVLRRPPTPRDKVRNPGEHLHPHDPRVLRVFYGDARQVAGSPDGGVLYLAPALRGTSCADAEPAICALVAETGDYCVTASEAKVGALISETLSKRRVEQLWLVPDGVEPAVRIDGRHVPQKGALGGNVYHVTFDREPGEVTLDITPFNAASAECPRTIDATIPDRITSMLSVFDRPPDRFDPADFTAFDNNGRPFRDGMRVVRRGSDGSTDLIFAVSPVGIHCDPVAPQPDSVDVCVSRQAPDGVGRAGFCTTLARIRAGVAIQPDGGSDGAGEHTGPPGLYGVVADGVRSIRVELPSGPVEMAATDNYVHADADVEYYSTFDAPRTLAGVGDSEQCPPPAEAMARYSVFGPAGDATVSDYVVSAEMLGVGACEDREPGVCIDVKDALGRRSCQPLAVAARWGVQVNQEKPGSTTIAVLVPDGVERVRFNTFGACGTEERFTEPVRGNLAEAVDLRTHMRCARVAGLD